MLHAHAVPAGVNRTAASSVRRRLDPLDPQIRRTGEDQVRYGLLDRRIHARPSDRCGTARTRPGRPLETKLREFFEPRLNIDLSGIRIHADGDAAAAARGVRARAYTVGSHVVFGQGQYSPDTSWGRWLLAHELAHIAQAGNSGGADRASAVERDASAAATRLSLGRKARVHARRDPRTINLFGEPDHVPDLTFVSTHGGRGFLDQAFQFHMSWGLAPQRFNSMQGLLAVLAAGHGPIPRLRIVSHANFDNIFTPLFDGGAAGITEEDLNAYAEGDVAGLRRTIAAPLLRNPALPGQVLTAVRTANIASLRPFGLDPPGSIPTGPVAQLIEASIDLLAVRSATGRIPAPQRAVLDTALTAELAGLRTQVQQPTPIGAGVTAAQAQDLVNAVLAVTGFPFRMPAQPPQFIAAVRAAAAGLAHGFRTNLDAVRARLSSSSWIDLRGCRVGQHPTYLAAVAHFFGSASGRPHVSGPDLFQSYPTIGFQVVSDRSVAALAANSDVRSAIDRWAVITGIRDRLLWWLTFLGSVLSEEARQTTAPTTSLPPPPALAGGLRLRIDPFIASRPPFAELPLPPLEDPTPIRRRPPSLGLGGGRLTNPLVAAAQRDIPRYAARDGELRYYLDAGLPLPVQQATNVQNIRLLLKSGLERQAMDAWLNSEWEPAAPGLSALQSGSWARAEPRQVEAVSDLDDHRRTLAMFVSPDPRYAQHIQTT
jgi:uncharacterized protein DUF4157